MRLSFAAGRAVATESADTLADGMATRVPDEEALDDHPPRRVRASCWSTTTRSPPRSAPIGRDTHNLAEGAGAAPLAAALQERDRLAGKKVGLVLSGGNIDFELFQRWVAGAAARRPHEFAPDGASTRRI